MTRTILVGEVRTGRRITQIPVADARWSVKHLGAGSITVDIPLGASDFRSIERSYVGGLYPGVGVFPGPGLFPEEATPVWRPGMGMRSEFLSAVEPARCFLAVLEGDTVIEAGPIWTWDYDPSAQMLTVAAAGMRSIFDHRYVMGVLAGGALPAEWSVTYTGLSLGTIAKRLVQLAQSHTGGALPIVLPADEASSSERVYKGHELAAVGDRLEQLSGVIDGPDVAFEPRLTADRLGVEWVMRVGTAADPLLHQAGDDHVWDMRVPRGGISGISVRRDATGLASRAWATGSGMDEALLMASASDPTLINAGFPLLEVAESRSSVEQQGTLDRWASGGLAKASRPWMTWSFTVDAASNPPLGSYRCGDWARIWPDPNDPLLSLMLPDGWHRARILNISGDMGSTVQLDLAPTMEAR